MHTEMKYRFLIHYTLSFIGGYLGLYAIVSRADLFGNAQTANLLGVVRDLIGRNFSDMLLRVGALLIYMAAVILTVWIPEHFPQIFVLPVSGSISLRSCSWDSFLPECLRLWLFTPCSLQCLSSGVPSRLPADITAPRSFPPTTFASSPQLSLSSL